MTARDSHDNVATYTRGIAVQDPAPIFNQSFALASNASRRPASRSFSLIQPPRLMLDGKREAESQRVALEQGYKGTEASAISRKRMSSGGLGPVVGNW